MTDEEHLAASLRAVYSHEAERHHGLRFYVSNLRLEFVCLCGEVLYEGPIFQDGFPGFEIWRAPKRGNWRGRKRGRVAAASSPSRHRR
jgi:hypothetical protein